MHIHMHALTHSHTYTLTHAHTLACMDTHTHTKTDRQTHTHMHTPTHFHTHIHTLYSHILHKKPDSTHVQKHSSTERQLQFQHKNGYKMITNGFTISKLCCRRRIADGTTELTKAKPKTPHQFHYITTQ